MNIISNLEFISQDLTLLIIQKDNQSDNSLYGLLKLFFNKSKNITLCNGQDGCYEKEKFDLVMCDITAEDLDYVSICEKIKTNDPDQSIIVIVDQKNVNEILKLINLGINQFIALPLNNEELQYRLLKNCEMVFYKKFYEKNSLSNKTDKSIDILVHKKMSFKEFDKYLKANNISKEKFEKLTQNLLDLNAKFNKCIEKLYINKLSADLIDNIIEVVGEIIIEFRKLDSLDKLSNVLNEFIEFLKQIEFEKLSYPQKDKLKIIEFIYDDISRYINTVFIYKDTIDVHYLEDSLRSSILQIKQSVLNIQIQEEELELF